jgi:hypothetical protein
VAGPHAGKTGHITAAASAGKTAITVKLEGNSAPVKIEIAQLDYPQVTAEDFEGWPEGEGDNHAKMKRLANVHPPPWLASSTPIRVSFLLPE